MSRPSRHRSALRKALLGLALSLPLAAGADSVPEYQIKATYLYNFAAFVSWPDGRAQPRSPTFRYCMFGAGPVEQALRTLVRGEAVDGRPLEVQRVTAGESLAGCQVLYLAETAGAAAADLLGAVAGTPVLTVGDSEDFVHQGGMIGLVRQRLKLQVIIALDRVQRCQLRVNARLLQLATVVGRAPGAPE